MKQTVEIQNLKIGGFQATTMHKLQSLKGIDEVSFNLENSTISFSNETDEAFMQVEKMLPKLGYTFLSYKSNLSRIVKSYHSWALGRIEN